jgi:hypothetical protein
VSSADEVALSEITLYQQDREAWIVQSAPKMAKILAESSDTTLGRMWADMKRDYQTSTWQHMDATQRERIRKLRGAK